MKSYTSRFNLWQNHVLQPLFRPQIHYLHNSKTYMFTNYVQIIFYTLLCNTLYTHTIPIELTDTDNYLPPDDPNITNLMVSHYDCEKQHNLRQFNLLNVKPCTEALSNIQHAKVRARFYVRAQAKRVKAFKCEAYAKKEKSLFSRHS